ncbi:MAG: hypothetical protein ACI9UA_004943 [Pseudoalteromonas tetraodonis]|jgi:hypothetical protein
MRYYCVKNPLKRGILDQNEMSEKSKTARIELSLFRRQWLKVAAFVGDHPWMATIVSCGAIGLVLFYGMYLGGFSHFFESGSRWRLETFGGRHEVERSVQTPDVVLSLRHPPYDRLDVTTPTAVHLGGTAFRKELRSMLNERGGRLRINVLDPRLTDPSNPNHARFVELAGAFGMTRHELSARCWHSAAVLLHLAEEFGEKIEIRLIAEPVAGAKSPYFCIGRSGHSYQSENPKKRLDVIVPRPAESTNSDSFTHPGLIIKDRPNNDQVIRFTDAFKSAWDNATPLDQALQDELQNYLDGKSSPAS